jgi:hypothetical protein
MLSARERTAPQGDSIINFVFWGEGEGKVGPRSFIAQQQCSAARCADQGASASRGMQPHVFSALTTPRRARPARGPGPPGAGAPLPGFESVCPQCPTLARHVQRGNPAQARRAKQRPHLAARGLQQQLDSG